MLYLLLFLICDGVDAVMISDAQMLTSVLHVVFETNLLWDIPDLKFYALFIVILDLL